MKRLSISGSPRRLAAASGILFFALVMAAPEPRPTGDPPSPLDIKRFYLENEQSFRLSLLLVGLGYALFLVFMAVASARLRTVERGDGTLSALAMASGALVAGFYVLGTALEAVPGLELVTPRTDPAQAETWRLFASESFDTLVEVSTFWRGVMLAAVSLVVLRYGGLPRWLGWTAAALAFGALVGPALGWFESPVQPVGFVLGYGSFIAFHFWVLLTSIVLTLRAGRSSASQPIS
jgi:hypothetical protein